MSSKTSQTSISHAAKKWLNSFSDQVDFQRLQRGIMLYNKDHVLDIEIEPIGFKAVVLGTKNKRYEVTGEFILNGYFPDIRNWTITCSCPDEVQFCKHSVCAAFYLISHLEKSTKKTIQSHGNLLELQKCTEIIDSFKENVPLNEETLVHLPNESFWPFESSFNDAIKDIDYVLGSLLKEMKK
jgi:uncharacterized Zn finger protein